MSWQRSNGYTVESPHPSTDGRPPAPTTQGKPAAATRRNVSVVAPPSPNPRPPMQRQRSTSSDRSGKSRPKRNRNSGCRNPEVRKGVGSVMIVLGVLCILSGLVLTIVSANDQEGEGSKYPSSFHVVGPVLLGLAVVCILVGLLLYNIVVLEMIYDCLNLSDNDSFCRRRFPRLSAFIKPDNVAAVNRVAINNLQTAPARSALRKTPNPDAIVAIETEDDGGGDGGGGRQGEGISTDKVNIHRPGSEDETTEQNQANPHTHHQHYPPPRRKRAVTFSQGDDPRDIDGSGPGSRPFSTSSEPDRLSMQSEGTGGSGSLNGNSPSTSLLSLRHCKIYPKDEVFWTDTSASGTPAAAAVGVVRLESSSGGGSSSYSSVSSSGSVRPSFEGGGDSRRVLLGDVVNGGGSAAGCLDSSSGSGLGSGRPNFEGGGDGRVVLGGDGESSGGHPLRSTAILSEDASREGDLTKDSNTTNIIGGGVQQDKLMSTTLKFALSDIAEERA